MSVLFLWYPRCSTCQKAKKWLDEHNIVYETRDIKEDRPNAAELKTWYEKSGLELKRFFNTSGMVYKSMNLKDKLPHLSEEDALALLAADGMLVKRPLLIAENGVLAGFREAAYQELLG